MRVFPVPPMSLQHAAIRDPLQVLAPDTRRRLGAATFNGSAAACALASTISHSTHVVIAGLEIVPQRPESHHLSGALYVA